jgi:hypothetical protein
LSEIEFTTDFPWTHFNPASITDHFEESIITGTREMSGSAATSDRKVVIAFSESSIASSMFTSMTCAPFSTCWRATARPS